MRRSSDRRVFVVGLTGGLCTGKSLVASALAGLGASVVDADKIARGITAKGTGTYLKIIKSFGTGVTGPDGRIDRRALAGMVFGDPKKRRLLERITHPQIIKRMREAVKKVKNRVVVLDAPLLIEAGLAGMADALVVVRSTKERQITRCIRKFAVPRREALKRIRSQMALKEKLRMADFVIDNNGTKLRTRSQVKKLWREIAWR